MSTLRVYKDFLQRTLLLCLHYNDLGMGLRSAYDNARERRSGGYYSKETDAALSFLKGDPQFTVGHQDIPAMVELQTKLLNSTAPGADRDLIDTVVRVLQLPYARNILAGQSITRLRDAILLPEEIATARMAMLREEMACSACGHQFHSGEMTTFHNSGGTRQILCTNCATPAYMADRLNRDKIVPISRIKGLDAAIHRAPEPPKEGDAIELPPDLAPGVAVPMPVGPEVAGQPDGPLFRQLDAQSAWARNVIQRDNARRRDPVRAVRIIEEG